LVVVPGGGEFADTVRQLDGRFNLSNGTAHRMAILGMDQYGLLLRDLMPHDAVAISQLNDTKRTLAAGKLTVFLPAQLLMREDPLENSWTITSDSIALYIAYKLHAKQLLLITDVDGIYLEDPKQNPKVSCIETISIQQLLTMKRTSVDAAFAELLQKWKQNCIVINGNYPNRVKAVFMGQNTICTIIRC